ENVYNIDKIGVMLSILNSIKVFISKANIQQYRGAYIKQIIVTTIKYISANSRYFNPIII
ncbi:hypothetical protein B0J11DRAFT_441005, partial [Dendryphion nanum]